MPELPTEPDALIRSFCECWDRGDLDEMMSYFAEDAVYHNIPMEPCVGHAAIREFLTQFLTMASNLSFDVRSQIAAGNKVMNERVDTMTIGDNTVALPVAGAFDVVDGKIAAWRDYFDMTQFLGAGG